MMRFFLFYLPDPREPINPHKHKQFCLVNWRLGCEFCPSSVETGQDKNSLSVSPRSASALADREHVTGSSLSTTASNHGGEGLLLASSSCCVSVHECSGRVQTRPEILLFVLLDTCSQGPATGVRKALFRIQYRTRILIINTEQKDAEGLVGGASAAAPQGEEGRNGTFQCAA